MLWEIKCSQCGHILTLPDDPPTTSVTCPNCKAQLDVLPREPGPANRSDKGPEKTAPSLSEGQPAKWKGTPAPNIRAMIFGLLLPTLSVACIVQILFAMEMKKVGSEFAVRALALACLFFILDILVIVQIGYWMRWNKPAGTAALKAAVKGAAGAAGCVVVALAAFIFLFATCILLVNW